MWIGPLALAVGALLLAGPAYAVSHLAGGVLIVVAGIAAACALGIGLGPRLRARGSYDLEDLKRVHEREELRALDPEAMLGQPENVLCLRCMNEYPSRLRACPRCGVSC